MRMLILVLLAVLFPFMASARLVENLYDTNNVATVDAHVITLISGPTNGASLATITNVINGMVPTILVSNAQASATSGTSTNPFQGVIRLVHPNGTSSNWFGTTPLQNGTNLSIACATWTTNDTLLLSAGTYQFTNDASATILPAWTGCTVRGVGPETIIFGPPAENKLQFSFLAQAGANNACFSDMTWSNVVCSFDPPNGTYTNIVWQDLVWQNPNCIDNIKPSNNGIWESRIERCRVRGGQQDVLSNLYHSSVQDCYVEGTGRVGAYTLLSGDSLTVRNTIFVLGTNVVSTGLSSAIGDDNFSDNILWLDNVTFLIAQTNCTAINGNPTVVGTWSTNLTVLLNNGTQPFYYPSNMVTTTTYAFSAPSFSGNGAALTSLISTNEVVTTTTFASPTNKLVLNNGRWLLQSATPGSLTNITVVAPYTWATLVVSNSSATTNSFLISAAARYFGAVSTNLLQVYPGKMAYISIDALANVWTNICTVTQQ